MLYRLLVISCLCACLFGLTAEAQDSLNVTKIGELKYWYGISEIVTSDSLAFLATSESGLRIVDFTDLYEPYELSYYDPEPWTWTSDLVQYNSYIYMADYYLVRIVDISDPLNPIELITFEPAPGWYDANEIEIKDHYLFIKGRLFSTNYMAVVDIIDPLNPNVIDLTTPGHITAMKVEGDLLYITNASNSEYFLRVWDISDPYNIQMLDYTSIPSYCINFDVSEEFAYLSLSSSGGLKIYDVTDPSNITLASTFYPYYGYGQRVKIINNTALWGFGAYPEYGVFVIDITDPYNPFELSYSTQYGSSAPYCIVDQLGFIPTSENSFSVFNLADPCNWEFLGGCGNITDLDKLVINNNYAYIGNGYIGLWIIDLTDPEQPIDLGRNEFENFKPNDLHIMDNYLIASIANTGLAIFDIIDPINPVLIGLCELTGDVYPMDVDGIYAYVANGSHGLQIISIEDLYNPCLLTTITFGGNAYDAAKDGDFVYIATFEGIQIADVSDPSNPVLRGAYTSGDGHWIEKNGNYAYTISSGGGFDIVDVTNPNHPFSVGYLDLSYYLSDLEIDDNFAYICNTFFGLYIVDITDPTTPSIEGYYNTPGAAQGVKVIDNLVYLSDQHYFSIYNNELIVNADSPSKKPVPASFSLSPPHPNPFNPVTAVSIQLSAVSHVKLSVYDVTGSKVATLIEGERTPGVYEVTFNGEDLPSGIYFARLTAGEMTQTQKLVLLK